MRQSQCQKSCLVCLGDIRQSQTGFTMPVSLHVCMFACKHVLFFVTQIYSLLFCHADFADDADLFFFTQSFLRRCRRSFLNFRLVCPTRLGLGASALYLSLRPVTVGSGCVGQILLLSFTFPLGVPPDLESGVKKCPNLFRLCGFAIRSKGECFPLCWGITNPPVLIGRTFFYGGFQIRRDAWRGCALGYYSVIALPSLSRTVQLPICHLVGR